MSAGHTPDTVGFDYRFVIPNAHTATIRTSRQMHHFVLEVFIPGTPQTINRFTIEQPRLAGIIHNREDNVMMGSIILNRLMGGESLLEQLPGFGVIDAAIFYNSFRWSIRCLLVTGWIC